MVGQLEGVKTELEAKRNSLESVKATLTAERYRKLSQQLEDYKADWETLNRDTQLACKDWAICQYRSQKSGNPMCLEARKAMEDRQKDARNFFERIRTIDASPQAAAEGLASRAHDLKVSPTKANALDVKDFYVDRSNGFFIRRPNNSLTREPESINGLGSYFSIRKMRSDGKLMTIPVAHPAFNKVRFARFILSNPIKVEFTDKTTNEVIESMTRQMVANYLRSEKGSKELKTQQDKIRNLGEEFNIPELTSIGDNLSADTVFTAGDDAKRLISKRDVKLLQNDKIKAMLIDMDFDGQFMSKFRRQMVFNNTDSAEFTNELIIGVWDKVDTQALPFKMTLDNFFSMMASAYGPNADRVVVDKDRRLTGGTFRLSNAIVNGNPGDIEIDRLTLAAESSTRFYGIEAAYSPQSREPRRVWDDLVVLIDSFRIIED
jgi:hypothetical protein